MLTEWYTSLALEAEADILVACMPVAGIKFLRQVGSTELFAGTKRVAPWAGSSQLLAPELGEIPLEIQD